MATEKKLYTGAVYNESNVCLLNRISAIFQRRHINIESHSISVSEIKEKLKRSPKQLYLFINLLKLNLREFISVDDLKKKFDVSSSLIKNLIDKDILKEHFIEINRFNNTVSTVLPINKLSQSQEKAYEKIQLSFKKNNPVLFHGVTSSGKTEVYVKLIQDALIQKNQILYLVPEIALTTQVVRRLTNFFGDKVLVYHSGYSINQRVEVWNKISTNKSCQLIVGARSSLLMPFKNLKLIIVDEEHEQSYKQQEPAPRYHARDASLVLSRIFKSNILWGSATPSVESYNNAVVLNKYDLVELKKRYNDVLMPVIELIDLKMKYAKKLMKCHFSDSRVNEIFNTVKVFTETPYEQTNMSSYMLTDAWRPDNTSATIAQLGGDRQNNYSRSSDMFIEDGSFLRFKNISLGYTIPENLSRKVNIEKLRFYVALQNYFTITKYTGREPELGSTWGVLVQSADLGNYTIHKTV